MNQDSDLCDVLASEVVSNAVGRGVVPYVIAGTATSNGLVLRPGLRLSRSIQSREGRTAQPLA